MVGLVVFDFDGTLCDSAHVKTRAFRDLYLEEQGQDFADRVLAYHLANAGLPRFDKIRHIEIAMLGNEDPDARVAEMADRFSGLVEQAVVDAPLFPGVDGFLDRYRGRVPLAIASATPTDELRRITERKGIDGCFDAIEGSPRSKASILVDLASSFGVGVGETLMVGDQPSDADGARSAGTQALIIATPQAWTEPFPTVGSFLEAAEWLDARISAH